jgi:hypothetical protein
MVAPPPRRHKAWRARAPEFGKKSLRRREALPSNEVDRRR